MMKQAILLTLAVIFIAIGCDDVNAAKSQPSCWNKPGFDLPVVDLDARADLQIVVDREKGQYLGHPSTHLLADGKTILCVYPKGHGRGAIVYKKSTDGGKTWSKRLPTPKTWATSREVPTLYPTIDAAGKKRILMFSGCGPKNRLAISEDNAKTWSELKDIPTQKGGIVVMGDLIALTTGKGHYMATYHARATRKDAAGKSHRSIELYVCFTKDGGVTWSAPVTISPGTPTLHLCEGGFVRSPDGKEIALLLRENSRNNNSQIMFTRDEGKTWTTPKPMPGSMNGDRHQAIYLPDGRLLIQFRDRTPQRRKGYVRSPSEGDWCGWVGTYADLKNGREGQYRIRFKDNKHGWDTTYPAAELLADGTLVCTTYGHFAKNEKPYILSMRFKIATLDKLATAIKTTGTQPPVLNDMGTDAYLYDPNHPERIRKHNVKK